MLNVDVSAERLMPLSVAAQYTLTAGPVETSQLWSPWVHGDIVQRRATPTPGVANAFWL